MKIFSKRTQITTIFLILILLLAACERPFRTDTSDGDPETTDGVIDTTEEDTGAEESDGSDVDSGSEGSDSDGADTDTGEETTDEGTDEAATEEGEDDASRPDAEATEEGDDGAADDGADTDGDTTEEGAEQEDDAADEGEDTSDSGDVDSDEGDEESDSGEEADTDESGDDTDADGEDQDEDGDTADEEEDAADDSGTAATGPISHIVVAGENLYRIGLQYNVSWLAIAQANNLPNANAIYVGQELTIPGSETISEGDEAGEDDSDGETGEVTHVVQAGESLHTIGLKYNVSWTQIAEANGLVNPNRILVGQILKIPTDAPGPAPQFVHTVQTNETLFILALRYGVLWTDIATANEIEAPYVIFPGQQLVIPGG